MQANWAGSTLMVEVWLGRNVGGCEAPAGGGITGTGSLEWWNDVGAGGWSSPP